jgi:acyl carrier protein
MYNQHFNLLVPPKLPPHGRIYSMATVEERVVDIVFEQFHVQGLLKSEINRGTRFIEDLGADSLDITELVMELEDQFSEGELSLDIPDEDVEEFKAVGQVIDHIEKWRESQGGSAAA